MIIRSFRNADSEEILKLWNSAHHQYSLTAELMAKKIFLDVNFLPESILVGEDKDRLIAFAYLPSALVSMDRSWKVNDKEGFISYFSIHPDEDFNEIGKIFLQALEDRHKNAGRTRLSTAYIPLYHLQGFSEKYDMRYIDLFRQAGYTENVSCRRRRKLSDYQLSDGYFLRKADLEKEGFYIGALPYEYLAEFVSSTNSFSNGAWAWQFRSALSHTTDLGRARVAIYNGRIIGGCIFGDPYSDEGRFGPFGMDPEYRGKGIGSVIFADCLNEMKKRGISEAWAQWTPTSGAANSLYNKAGFLTEDRFYTFEKETE